MYSYFGPPLASVFPDPKKPKIGNVLRFDGTNDYLNRVVTASNRTTWTWSAWVKRDDLSRREYLFSGGASGDTSNLFYLQWERNHTGGNNELAVVWREADSNNTRSITTTASYNDTSAWYHVVLSVDTTQSAASDKMKLYVNGTEVTSFTDSNSGRSSIDTNDPLSVNAAGNMCMGAYAYDLSSTSSRFKGLMAEVHFIDGQALDYTPFAYSFANGVHIPKKGVADLDYGNNGFYLDFAGNDTGVTLLLDGSGGGTATITDNSSAGNDMTNVSSGVSNLSTTGPYNSTQNVLDFDGTSGDYLTILYNSSFSFGSDNFTIEMWMKRAAQNGRTWLMGQCNSGANDYTWIEINEDNTIEFQDVNIGVFTSTGTITNDGNWHHVALVRNGSTFTWFIDGTSSGTTTSASSLNNNTTNNFSIGRLGEYSGAGGTNYNGQLADIRITRGIAHYTGSFTPPTSALTNTPEYLGDFGVDRTTDGAGVVLKLNADNSLTDETGRHTPTGAGVSYSTDTPFTTGNSHSFSFSPTSSSDVSEVITLPNSTDFQFGSDPFTIEMWFKWDGTAGLQMLFNTYETTGILGLAVVLNGATLAIYATSNSSSWDIASAASGGISFTANTWHHLAIVRYSNGYIEAFKDGVKGTSSISTSTAAIYTNGTDDAHVGGTSNFYAFNGLIDDVRITKGIALYTNTFTPPTSALTNDDTWDKPKNNFSVEGNITPDDQLLDTPNLRFATLDPDFSGGGSGQTLSEGNLKYYCPVNNEGYFAATESKTSGKWYFEMLYDGSTNNTGHGIVGWTYTDMSQSGASTSINPLDQDEGGMIQYSRDQLSDPVAVTIDADASVTFTSPSTAPNDIFGVAFDADTRKIWFSVNNTWVDGDPGTDTDPSYSTLTSGKTYIPFIGHFSNNASRKSQAILNFGQDHTFAGEKIPLLTPYSDANGVGEFYYQPPSGFLALSTDPLENFRTKQYRKFATWDPSTGGSTNTYREGNLLVDIGDTPDEAVSTMGVSSGKIYAEYYWKQGTYFFPKISIGTADPPSDYSGFWSDNGNKYDVPTGATSYRTAGGFSVGSIISVAVDANTGTVWWAVDGSWQGGATVSEIEAGTTTNAAKTGLSGTLYVRADDGSGGDQSTEVVINFGQDHTFAGEKPILTNPYKDINGVGEFYYEPPSGYLALATTVKT